MPATTRGGDNAFDGDTIGSEPPITSERDIIDLLQAQFGPDPRFLQRPADETRRPRLGTLRDFLRYQPGGFDPREGQRIVLDGLNGVDEDMFEFALFNAPLPGMPPPPQPRTWPGPPPPVTYNGQTPLQAAFERILRAVPPTNPHAARHEPSIYATTTTSYQTSYQPAPPPTQQRPFHKVYRLSCSSCGNFLTNRGMRAVLLLRQDIHLYSTDAPPCGCSSPPPSSIPQTGEPIQRTCDCLTQTLCCHGCGNQCGYAIVTPCAKCSSSGTPEQDGANGHRFVFHQSEVAATERLYVHGEPDVIRAHPPQRPPGHTPNFSRPLASAREYHPHDPHVGFGDQDDEEEDESGSEMHYDTTPDDSPAASVARSHSQFSISQSIHEDSPIPPPGTSFLNLHLPISHSMTAGMDEGSPMSEANSPASARRAHANAHARQASVPSPWARLAARTASFYAGYSASYSEAPPVVPIIPVDVDVAVESEPAASAPAASLAPSPSIVPRTPPRPPRTSESLLDILPESPTMTSASPRTRRPGMSPSPGPSPRVAPGTPAGTSPSVRVIGPQTRSSPARPRAPPPLDSPVSRNGAAAWNTSLLDTPASMPDLEPNSRRASPSSPSRPPRERPSTQTQNRAHARVVSPLRIARHGTSNRSPRTPSHSHSHRHRSSRSSHRYHRAKVPSTPPNRLQPGDIVWWHNLTRAGDIPGVNEEFVQEHWRELEDEKIRAIWRGMKGFR